MIQTLPCELADCLGKLGGHELQDDLVRLPDVQQESVALLERSSLPSLKAQRAGGVLDEGELLSDTDSKVGTAEVLQQSGSCLEQS